MLAGRDQVSLKAICAYMNSTVGLVWFKNRGKVKGDMIFLQGDSLSVFPIPKVSFEKSEELDELVNEIQALVSAEDNLEQVFSSASYLELQGRLDDLIFEHYKLTSDEIEALKSEAANLQ